MLAGRFDRGCVLLDQSHRIDPKAGTLFTLAECYGRAGKTASAVRHYALYLTLYELMTDEQSRAHSERAAVARPNATSAARVPSSSCIGRTRPGGCAGGPRGAPLDSSASARAQRGSR